MMCLSIQQPWAWCILHAGKDVENRTWRSNYRGPLLVHAGKQVDREAFDYIEDVFGVRVPRNVPTGAIVGMVEMYDCRFKGPHDSAHFSRWHASGQFGFYLRNQIAITKPVPMRGQLGIFAVADEIKKQFEV